MNLTGRARRFAATASLGVVGALALSGCSQGGGVAARVDGTVIPMSDVDLLTRVQCDSMAAQRGMPGASVVPISQVRAQAVNALVEAEINRQLGESLKPAYDTEQYRASLDQLESALGSVEAKDRDATRELITRFYRGQFQLMALAEAELADKGVSKPNDDELRNAEAALQSRFRKGADIRVDPSFGPDSTGVAGQQDPSISVPVSSFAKQAASQSPKPSWVMDLPAGQQCG